MNLPKYFLVIIPRYAIFLVIVLFVLSMMAYGGGTINVPDAIGNSFTRNFFSDLGRFTPDNIISAIFFTAALSICGLAFSGYFIYFIQLFKQNNLFAIMAKIGSISGIIGALCFVGVGFAPHNIFFGPHVFFVKWAFRSFLITAILFTLVLYKDDRFENHYASGYLTFAILIFIYILILELGPSPSASDFSLIFNVLAQKLIILVFMLSVLYQSFGNSKLLAKKSNK
ncbi:MAG: hypothetical protein U9N31_02725 [Candidatus Marinimicrobia bacterium]|nr:hypothetical protein [Candidatus Neomarinimicrobiota bacterium]